MQAVYFRRFIFSFILLLSGTLVAVTKASVTLIGSRIIYPAAEKSVDVQLKNKDDFPYVIQTWFDRGDVNAKPNAASPVPFIASPPIFRVQPGSGQVIRIAFTGSEALPQDRESLFWFNVLQIPPANIERSGANKILVTLRTRIKLFYRPAALAKPADIAGKLQVKAIKQGRSVSAIEITNPQPWFASVSSLQLFINGVAHQLEAETLPPLGRKMFRVPADKLSGTGKTQVQVTLINDQGARISERYDLTF